MKKLIVLLLSVSLLLVSFAGCTETKEPDVWDGSIAETYESGDGSLNNPYVIEKASQLALLAQQVNAGTDYKGKYVSLDRDLDLHNCEWTPIGNGMHFFNGIFDGNNHTIFNLTITDGIDFITENSEKEINQYTTGLFGSCYDATIKNITINKASVTIQKITNASSVMGGILIGTMRSDSNAEISNVSIIETKIDCTFELDNNNTSLRVGGIIGYVYGNDMSSIKMNNINSDTAISIKDGNADYNIVGGIVGAASINNVFDVSNCASYLSVSIDTENSYSPHNYFGAFGSMQTKNNIVSISNVFSKATIDNISLDYSAYNANALIGETNHAKQTDGTRIGGYEFQNLFGYVEQVDASTGETAKLTQLYELPNHTIYTETNCLVCESLPADHGFDVSVWDLTDLSRPKVKMN